MKAFLNTQAAPLIFQYSGLLWGCLLGPSWVNECKAFHLVYVCQRWAWSPLNAVSADPLIEPDQFAETASRLAQLPHQRDSNNGTMWPLLSLKKPYLCLLQSKNGSRRRTLFFLTPREAIWRNLRTEQTTIQKYNHSNWALIRFRFAANAIKQQTEKD